ncbi:hypothetical protein TNIN_429831 [Trichonephila inaurata madagascariensis]|uniref:Uncharacterized protein n=1 Tax=Trichonephila inaurata madagascariensis TaxID=2747483 RepID=A0A8X6WKS2_9ARAC|nr:hypothetical protein TNIN_429831 [Trichonephila inaurata madagascariensis]
MIEVRTEKMATVREANGVAINSRVDPHPVELLCEQSGESLPTVEREGANSNHQKSAIVFNGPDWLCSTFRLERV